MSDTNATGLRVVVVGATGNVGTSVVQALGQDPEVGSVLGLARRIPQWSPLKTTWASVDVGAEDDLVPHFRGADAVIHLAWLFQPTHDPVTTWRTNVLGSIRVFEAVAEAGARALVYASSVGAYSPGPQDRSAAVDESWPTHGWPGAAYTREKAYLERTLDAFEHRYPALRVVRMRPAFIFKRESANAQRRLFGGPLVPGSLVRPSLLPFVPDVPGLRFQALHTEDAGEAYRLAATRPVQGAFNLAAEPVIDVPSLERILRARPVRLPVPALRAGLAAAWHLRLVPASPGLFDAVLRLPLMDTTRAREELGWTPRYSAEEGMPTAPLAQKRLGGRLGELATGIGQRP
jgi:UDP-glucose 4-epimerase